ncbi:MAG: acyl-CoA dehydrogenase family protein, partial [Planctomycetota bacterium]|nr:acyl-CoA dehydrogenase family protein [Planctomycetota bacterium]
PYAVERDRLEEYPRELLRHLGQAGFLRYPFPKEWGGEGGSFLGFITIAEELARCDASTSVIMLLNPTLVAAPILAGGSEDLKKRVLPGLFSGELLGCFCLTEPEAGSDAASLKTTASLVGDEFVIEGEKIFIQQGDVADIALVVCKVRMGNSKPRTSVLLAEGLKGRKGIERRRLKGKMGIRAATTGYIRFNGFRVPRKNLIGELGGGFGIVLETLNGGRLGIGAQAVGIAQGAFDRAFKRARERVQFGKPLIELGAIEGRVAEMATAIEAARSLLYRAAMAKDAGQDYRMLACMAKLFASEVANRVSYDAVQICGGFGYIGELSDVERFYRDARITEIYEGTSEIQRLLITRYLKESCGYRNGIH